MTYSDLKCQVFFQLGVPERLPEGPEMVVWLEGTGGEGRADRRLHPRRRRSEWSTYPLREFGKKLHQLHIQMSHRG